MPEERQRAQRGIFTLNKISSGCSGAQLFLRARSYFEMHAEGQKAQGDFSDKEKPTLYRTGVNFYKLASLCLPEAQV